MKITLRILKGNNAGYHDLRIKTLCPAKGDLLVYKSESYTVSYLEFDYDTDTVYVICI